MQQRQPGSNRTGSYDCLFKFLLLGDSGVGKSCLLLRYADDMFTTSFITTIGIDYKIKTIDIGGLCIKLQIWDTAGQDRFRTANNNSVRGVHGIVIAFDMTDEQSFQNVRNWLRHIEQYGSGGESIILVGTKCDMWSERVVEEARAKALADEYNIPFIMTSAKSDIGVTEAFTTLAKKVLNENEQFEYRKPKPPAAPPPPPLEIGIGQKIGNFFLWPFRQIWAGVKAIGRGFQAAGRGFVNLFRTSSNPAQPPPPVAAPPHLAPSIRPAPAGLTPEQQTQQLREAKIQAEIAELKHKAAAAEREAAFLKRDKEKAEQEAAALRQARDETSARALLEKRSREEDAQPPSYEEPPPGYDADSYNKNKR